MDVIEKEILEDSTHKEQLDKLMNVIDVMIPRTSYALIVLPDNEQHCSFSMHGMDLEQTIKLMEAVIERLKYLRENNHGQAKH